MAMKLKSKSRMPYLAATLLPLLVVIAAVALLIIAVINSAYVRLALTAVTAKTI